MEDLIKEYAERQKRGETFAGEYSIVSRLVNLQALIDNTLKLHEDLKSRKPTA
jgi:hypothetical protein